MKIFNYIIFFLRGHELKATFLLFSTLLYGLVEMLSVALIFPVINFSLIGLGVGGGDDGSKSMVLNFYKQISVYVSMPEIIVSSIILMLTAIITYLAYLSLTWFQLKFVSNLVLESKKNIFKKLILLEYSYFVSTKNADIFHVLFKATESLTSFSDSFIKAFTELIKLFFYVSLMLYISIYVTIILVFIGAVYWLISKTIITKVINPTSKLIRENEKDQLHTISEFINNIREIKVYLQTRQWLDRYSKEALQYAVNFRKNQLGASVLSAFPAMIMGLAVGVSGLLVHNANIGVEAASIFAIVFIAGQRVNGSISMFLSFITAINNHTPNIKSMHKLLTIEAEKRKIKKGVKYIEWNSMTLKNVDFSYESGCRVLKDINLVIKKNTTCAIVGESGSGKSTLISLILKFYSTTSGDIHIGDTPLNKIRSIDFWSKVGVVSQNSAIINGTVRENIVFGRSFSDVAVDVSIQQARISNFINSLDNGLDTIIQEKGSNLSGGQKQRIMIARAIIGNPDILILDEVTSALDQENENKINDLIGRLSGKKTIIIITHKHHMTKYADHVYRLNGGRLSKILHHESDFKE
jgi:ABC-type bacteriocin/lantibiotic exporter with double-glycine peptidase domain